MFYAHRDLEQLLDAYEKGEPFYLYTGRVRDAVHKGRQFTNILMPHAWPSLTSKVCDARLGGTSWQVEGCIIMCSRRHHMAVLALQESGV